MYWRNLLLLNIYPIFLFLFNFLLKKSNFFSIINRKREKAFKRGNDYITSMLIDKCGLKGYNVGDAYVSDLHAGFIINKQNATAKEVLELIEYIKKKVYKEFNKKIELEIEVLGED